MSTSQMDDTMPQTEQTGHNHMPAEAPPSSARRGFAAMDRETVRLLAKRGGVAAHVRGTAHQFTPEEARVAGRKGGLAAHRRTEPSAPPQSLASPKPGSQA